MDAVLLCTVGGSPEPIVRTIRSLGPAYVCFFCTDADPATGKAGSREQVEEQGIAAQAGLEDDCFEICVVPADDMDGAYVKMREAAARLADRGERLVANYTGGTKTMTAALVCAALEREDVALQLVSGARPSLDEVQSGTEEILAASVDRLRLSRAMSRHLDAWSRFAYSEAIAGLDAIKIDAGNQDRQRPTFARTLSAVFARWDDFDHNGAWERLDPFRKNLWKCYPRLWSNLESLRRKKEPRTDLLRLWDLWRNAERRAAQGRHDDAVARWYRLVEWTAQWLLRRKPGEETADFPPDLLPRCLDVRPAPDGKIKLGLTDAWCVVADQYEHEAPGRFHRDHAEVLRDLLKERNESILAHGFKPVTAEDWRRVRAFTEQRFLPMLRAAANEANLELKEPEQLPTHAPECIAGGA